VAEEYLRPTAYTNADGNWLNPTQAYDGVGASDNGTFSHATGGDAIITWSGFPVRSQDFDISLYLHVVHEFVGDAVNDEYTLEYSYNNGVTWFPIVPVGVGVATAKTDWSKLYIADTPTEDFQIRAFLDKLQGADVNIEPRVWEIYFVGEYTAEVIEWGDPLPINATVVLTSSGQRDRASTSALLANVVTASIGQRDRFSTANLTGASTLTGTAVAGIIKLGSASLSSTTNLTAIGQRDKFGVSPLDVTTNLTASGVRDRFALSALTALVNVTSVGSVSGVQLGSASLSATATTVAVGTVSGIQLGVANLTSATTLTAIGDTGAIEYGSATLLATTEVVSASSIDRRSSTTINATTALISTAKRDRNSTANLTADVNLTAIGDTGTIEYGSATLSSSTTLSSVGQRDRFNESNVISTTALTAIGKISGIQLGSASLSATTNLTAIGSVGGEVHGIANISSNTAVNTLGGLIFVGAVTLACASTVDSVGVLDKYSSIQLLPTSTLTATGSISGVQLGVCNLISGVLLTSSGYLELKGTSALTSNVTVTAIGQLEGISDVYGESALITSTLLKSRANGNALTFVPELTANLDIIAINANLDIIAINANLDIPTIYGDLI